MTLGARPLHSCWTSQMRRTISQFTFISVQSISSLIIIDSQYFNDIMPAIYSRFMDKEASEWRQIYKALQLLEYLIKNGSERVVDDARSHISTLKMLRSFHYIDEKARDQGLNIRTRAQEIVKLLQDQDAIRSERLKARNNRGKYGGVGSMSGPSYSSDRRYGGHGSDSYNYCRSSTTIFSVAREC